MNPELITATIDVYLTHKDVEENLARQFRSPPSHNVGDIAGFKGFFDVPIIWDGSANCGDQDPLRGWKLHTDGTKRAIPINEWEPTK